MGGAGQRCLHTPPSRVEALKEGRRLLRSLRSAVYLQSPIRRPFICVAVLTPASVDVATVSNASKLIGARDRQRSGAADLRHRNGVSVHLEILERTAAFCAAFLGGFP